VSELVSGEIAEDIAYYYASSEQVPTVCILGVLVDIDYTCKAAGGLLLQLLPFADESIIDKIEENVKKASSITSLLTEKSLEDILGMYLEGIPFDVFDKLECGYKCVCSKEKTENALISLGKKELDDLINSPEPTVLTCQFCDKVYEYSKEELMAIRNRL
jgi:molecular chaperone Hsp33